MAYCGDTSLVKHNAETRVVLPLACRRWSCENCAPRRQKQLVALGIAGKPSSFLTLTVRPVDGQTPADRARALVGAFRTLLARANDGRSIARWNWEQACKAADELGKPRPPGPPKPRKPNKKMLRTQYLAVFEKTKKGEPHLHVLLRSHFLPVGWISDLMGELIGAPIVFIEKVTNPIKAARYIAKYISKDPVLWPGSKRYWRSLHWAPSWKNSAEFKKTGQSEWYVVQISTQQVVRLHIEAGYTAEQQDGAWVLTPPKAGPPMMALP